MNSEGITLEDTLTMEFIGKFNNNWRQRVVRLYIHPSDPDKVVTVGTPFIMGEPVVCVEKRSDYPRQLEHGDWSDYD